jgi:lipopolysaccharide export system permease protein
MWFFNRYSQVLHRGFGVTVSELDAQRREVSRIVATEAAPTPRGDGWVFKSGRELTFDPASGELQGTAPFADKLVARYHEDPKLMLLIDRPVRDLSFPELRLMIDYFTDENSEKITPYAVRYFSLIADTLGPLIVIAIAIPFAVTGVRVNPAVGVSKSFGLFFLYYILTNIASSLATKQVIDPVLAAWLPNLGMIGLAAWLFARMR